MVWSHKCAVWRTSASKSLLFLNLSKLWTEPVEKSHCFALKTESSSILLLYYSGNANQGSSSIGPQLDAPSLFPTTSSSCCPALGLPGLLPTEPPTPPSALLYSPHPGSLATVSTCITKGLLILLVHSECILIVAHCPNHSL